MPITNLRFPGSPLRLLYLNTALSRQYVTTRKYVTTRTPATPPIVSPTRSASYPPVALSSLAQWLDESHQRLKVDKWGWVIYRTSYKDEVAWDRFRRDLTRWSDEELELVGVSPFLRDTAELTFVSDPALEGVSHAELRRRFRAWRARAYYTETRRQAPQTWWDIPQRYLYFVEVDEAALDSVVQAGVPGGGPAVVNFLHCETNRTLPLDEPRKLDKWGSGDDCDVWPIKARSIIDVVFWRDMLDLVDNPGIGPMMHELMDWEMEAIEMEREGVPTVSESAV